MRFAGGWLEGRLDDHPLRAERDDCALEGQQPFVDLAESDLDVAQAFAHLPHIGPEIGQVPVEVGEPGLQVPVEVGESGLQVPRRSR